MRRRVLAVLLSLTASVSTANAQPVALDRSDHPSSLSARGIAAADFNRDGWVDLVTAHHDPDGVSVLLNRGRAGGYTSSFISLPGGPFGVTKGDLNKDGKPDIAVANPDANLINVLYGFGDGTFRAPLNVGGWFNPRGLTIADMDRDSNPDIVFTAYNNQSVVIYFGDGAQSFIHRQPLMPTVGRNPQGVAVADFNLDGWPDIVAANTASAGLTILYRTPNVMTFTPRELAVQAQNVVTVGDFDGDGRPDIAAASTATSDVTVVLNTRAGLTTATYPSGGGSTRGIVAADLNRDGALDLATGNRGTSTVEILLNNGHGTFAPAVGFAAGTGSRDVAAGDFDNDGRVDVATANEYLAAATVLSNTTALPRAAFAFTRQVIGPAENRGFSGQPTDAADMDQDGRMDALTLSGGATIYLADGRVVQVPGSNDVERDFAAADANRDGHPDVIWITGPFQQVSRIEAFLNDGQANFVERRVTQTTLIGASMDVADFNRDGMPDLLLRGSENGSPAMQVFLAVGDGTYRLAQSRTLATSQFMTIGDLNRDGAPDLITSTRGVAPANATVIALMNDGTGHFAEGSSREIPGFDGVWGGAIGDVNHDGYGDFAAGGTQSPFTGDNRLFVLLGGPAGFSAPVYLHAHTFISAALIADFDVDGHLDVLGSTGSLFRGHGDGTFEAEAAFDFFSPGAHIVDFNRDGLPDIVSAEDIVSVQVILNVAGDTNHAPTVTLGPDLTWEYAGQFYTEEATELWARATDADLHQATFHWTYPDGRTADTGTFPFLTVPILPPGRHEFVVEANDGRGGIGRASVFITVTPTKEIVVWPGAQSGFDTVAKGNWSIGTDATAAGGKVVRDINAGAPKVTTPLANPTSYVDIGFAADPTQTYKLWVRLKADSDNAANDSVWLQFTNAVDASGRTFAPGSTSGIEVVLEECSGCGESKWGWRDEAWGQRDMIGTVTVRFTKGGWQTLRLQTREDGVSVDQIVLSAETYLTTRPGTVKNDTTILSRRFF
jgi:hypothetical protein